MKVKIVILVFFLFATQVAAAQIMFQRHYGGIADDFGSRVLQMEDGGYLVASITESYGAGSGDIYLIRTNELGDVQWTKTYGGVGDEQPYAMKKTNDGNIIIAGRTSSYGTGSTDCYLLKINQSGDTLWTKTYGGINEDGAYDVIQTTDDGYLLLGYSLTFTSVFSSVYAIKTNSLGDTMWTKTYEKKNSNGGTSAIQLVDGGYIFCGTTQSSGAPTSDCYLIRTNPMGDTLWTKVYGGSSYDGVYQVSYASNGIVMTGTTYSFGAGSYDIFLSKFDYDGNEIWYKTYGGTNSDYGGSFSSTIDNGFIITGYTESFGMGGKDVYLIKTDINGDTLWTKTFGGSGDEWGGCVIQTLDNGFIVVGNTNSYGNAYDVYLVKTNSQGISGLERIINENIECKIFPNPSDGNLNIEFNNADNTNYNITIYDISGKLTFERKSSSYESIKQSLDLTGLRSGIYLLKLNFDNKCVTKKIIIQK
ncbi:MAG: T9SS type A sorting domain-containing protein [Bacteroidota bacterium]